MRSAKYKFTSIVNSKGAKREVRNWTKSLLDKTVPGHFRFGQKILDIFVVTHLMYHCGTCSSVFTVTDESIVEAKAKADELYGWNTVVM